MDSMNVVRLSNDRIYLCDQIVCRQELLKEMIGSLYPAIVDKEIDEIEHLISLLTPLENIP